MAMCRLKRLFGVLEAIQSSATNSKDVGRARAAVEKLHAQLVDLKNTEVSLHQQVMVPFSLSIQRLMFMLVSVCEYFSKSRLVSLRLLGDLASL